VTVKNKFDTFFNYAIEKGLYRESAPSTAKGKVASKLRSTDSERQRRRLKLLFGQIDLNSKTVLDIGAGKGFYSACAAHLGADRVVALEPEVDGSSF